MITRMDHPPDRMRQPGDGVVRAIATMERGIDALERLIAAQRETIGLLVIQLAARLEDEAEAEEHQVGQLLTMLEDLVDGDTTDGTGR